MINASNIELINASNIFEAKISLPELSFTDVFLPILFNMLFFFVTLFWFLCHWIFYHELIQKYPYYRWRKFFVDIAIFALMFMILSTSYQIYVKDKDGNFKIKNFHLFMLLIISWYILAILWHLSDRKLRTLRWHLRAHYWRLGTFISLFFLSFKWSSSLVYHLLFESFLSYETYEEGVRYVIMVIVMGAIIGYSIKRLTMFIRKNERVSLQCCLFYNNDELIPCLMNYKQQPYEPQSIASDLIIKTSKNLERGYNRRELWNDILNYCSRDLVEYLILYYLQKKNLICLYSSK